MCARPQFDGTEPGNVEEGGNSRLTPSTPEPLPRERFSRAGRLVLGLATALLWVPVLLDLLVQGRRRLFGYLASDAFY